MTKGFSLRGRMAAEVAELILKARYAHHRLIGSESRDIAAQLIFHTLLWKSSGMMLVLVAAYLTLITKGYLFTPLEIYARMSQLKNYFGFTGDETFTSEHLAYAKKFYVKDVGFSNLMTEFMGAVSPKTEKEFLRIINTYGV